MSALVESAKDEVMTKNLCWGRSHMSLLDESLNTTVKVGLKLIHYWQSMESFHLGKIIGES